MENVTWLINHWFKVHHSLKHSFPLSLSLPFSDVRHFNLLKVTWHLVLCKHEIVKNPRRDACPAGGSWGPRAAIGPVGPCVPPRQALSRSTQQRRRAGMGKVTWANPAPCESLAKGQWWGGPRSGQDPAHRLGWGWGLARWVARDWHLCNCVQLWSHRQVTL